MDNKERWISPETGESTDYAKEQAEKGRESLTEEIQTALPEREVFAEMAAHTVEKGDNLTKILKNHFGEDGFPNEKFLSVSYGFMEQYAGDANINFLGVGDVVSVENGKVTVKRAEGSKFADIEGVDIYPWDGPVPAAEAEEEASEGEEEALEDDDTEHDPYPANEGQGEAKGAGQLEEDSPGMTDNPEEELDRVYVPPTSGENPPEEEKKDTTGGGSAETEDTTGGGSAETTDDVETVLENPEDWRRAKNSFFKFVSLVRKGASKEEIEQGHQEILDALNHLINESGVPSDEIKAKLAFLEGDGVRIPDPEGNIYILSFSLNEDGRAILDYTIEEAPEGFPEELLQEARDFLSKYKDKKWFSEAYINKKKKVVEVVNPGAGANWNFEYSDSFTDLDQATEVLTFVLAEMQAQKAYIEGGIVDFEEATPEPATPAEEEPTPEPATPAEEPTPSEAETSAEGEVAVSPEELKQEARTFLEKYKDKKWFTEATINTGKKKVELVNPGWGFNPNFDHSNFESVDAAAAVLTVELAAMQAELAPVETTMEVNEVDADDPERKAVKDTLANWNADHPDQPDQQVGSIILAPDEGYGYAAISTYADSGNNIEKILDKVKEKGGDISGVNFVVSPNIDWNSDDYVYDHPNGAKYIVVNPHGSKSRAAEKIIEAL